MDKIHLFRFQADHHPDHKRQLSLPLLRHMSSFKFYDSPDRSFFLQCHPLNQTFVFLFRPDGSPMDIGRLFQNQHRSRVPGPEFSINLQPLKQPFPFVRDHHSHAPCRNNPLSLQPLNLNFQLSFSLTPTVSRYHLDHLRQLPRVRCMRGPFHRPIRPKCRNPGLHALRAPVLISQNILCIRTAPSLIPHAAP